MVQIRRNRNAYNILKNKLNSGELQNIVKPILTYYKLEHNNLFSPNKRQYAVLNNSGKFVGFAILTNNKNNIRYLEMIAISEKNQKQGYGTTLMRKIINNAKNNKKKIELHVQKPKKNSVPRPNGKTLVNYYRKFGFEAGNVNRNGNTPMYRN
jgi:ribosomal protein S18 acetylase RimI-like enzyme